MFSSRKTCAWVGLLFAVALGVRVAAVWALHAYHEPYTYEHGAIAENLLAGRGFSVTYLGSEGPTSQQAPLYPALVAASYAAFGVKTDAAHLALELLQCLAGASIALSAFSLARSLAPEKPSLAWLAGWGAALAPPQIYMVTHIQVVVWATTVLAALAAWVCARGMFGWRRALGTGLLSGLLLLIDPILALALPLLALIAWHRGRETGAPLFAWRPLAPVGVMAGVAVLVIAPWVARNYRVHGEFVFIKSSFGYAFWQGNNAASWGTDKIPKALETADASYSLADVNRRLAEARSETLYIDDVLLKPSGYVEFQGLTEPRRSRLLGARAKAFIAEHPGQYLRLCLNRMRYFFWIDETNPKASHPLYVACTAVWLGLFVLGLATFRPRDRAAWGLVAIVLAIGTFHALTISSARFRLPLEPLTFLWCAAGALRLGQFALQSARGLRRMVVGMKSRRARLLASNSHSAVKQARV